MFLTADKIVPAESDDILHKLTSAKKITPADSAVAFAKSLACHLMV